MSSWRMRPGMFASVFLVSLVLCSMAPCRSTVSQPRVAAPGRGTGLGAGPASGACPAATRRPDTAESVTNRQVRRPGRPQEGTISGESTGGPTNRLVGCHGECLLEALAADDPRVIGGFRLQSRLGAGGMGRVYLGFSPAGRAVAVKVIHPHLARDPAYTARFRREVAAAQAVNAVYAAPVVAAGPDYTQAWAATAF